MSAERREWGGRGGRWRDWKREGRRRSERAIQGTCPLSPSEHRGGGGAHALRETHTHILVATFSQPAPQTDSSKRSWEPARQSEGAREGGLEAREASTEAGEERNKRGFAPFFSLSSPGAIKGISPVLFLELNLLCTLPWQPRRDMGTLSPSHVIPLIVGLTSSGLCWLFQARSGALTWILLTHCTSLGTEEPFLGSLLHFTNSLPQSLRAGEWMNAALSLSHVSCVCLTFWCTLHFQFKCVICCSCTCSWQNMFTPPYVIIVGLRSEVTTGSICMQHQPSVLLNHCVCWTT